MEFNLKKKSTALMRLEVAHENTLYERDIFATHCTCFRRVCQGSRNWRIEERVFVCCGQWSPREATELFGSDVYGLYFEVTKVGQDYTSFVRRVQFQTNLL